MGLIGKIIGFASGFLPFKKGGKVQRRGMATGGIVMDSADKQAVASLVSKARNAGLPLKKGGRVKRR